MKYHKIGPGLYIDYEEKKKQCPVCKKTEWDYDVVEPTSNKIFCGDCYFDVKQYGYKHPHLMKISKAGYSQVFKSIQGLNQAINFVKKSKMEVTIP